MRQGMGTRTRDRRVLNKGLRYSADWTWVAAANFPCVERLTCSTSEYHHHTPSNKRGRQMARTRPLIHRLPPLLQSPLQRVINDRIQLVWIALHQSQIQNSVDLLLDIIFQTLTLLSATSGPILRVHLSFHIFHILQSLLEVILPTLSVSSAFLDKFQGTQAQTAFLVRFCK